MKIANGISPYKSIDVIELDGVAQGITLALKYGYKSYVINVDSQTELKIDNPPWTVRGKVGKIKVNMGRIKSYVIEHCFREANALTDAIVVIGTNERSAEIEIASLSKACNVIIGEHKRGKLYEKA